MPEYTQKKNNRNNNKPLKYNVVHLKSDIGGIASMRRYIHEERG